MSDTPQYVSNSRCLTHHLNTWTYFYRTCFARCFCRFHFSSKFIPKRDKNKLETPRDEDTCRNGSAAKASFHSSRAIRVWKILTEEPANRFPCISFAARVCSAWFTWFVLCWHWSQSPWRGCSGSGNYEQHADESLLPWSRFDRMSSGTPGTRIIDFLLLFLPITNWILEYFSCHIYLLLDR